MAIDQSCMLSLRDVAAWQIPGIRPDTPDLRAALPALQRGAVWRAPQVEDLWDSVLRGFPVGAFLLAPFEESKGVKGFAYGQREAMATATHHLLDGQQRSNALALGFLDPWANDAIAAPPAVLWVDLEAPDPKDQREVVFRVLTRSHPWGYAYNSMASEGHRLSAPMMRNAGQAYAASTPALRGKGAGELPLASVWPWDARTPVPFCFLLQAVDRGEDVPAYVRRRMIALPFWKNDLANAQSGSFTARLLEILDSKFDPRRERFDRIVDRVGHLLGKRGGSPYRIPALVVPEIMATAFRSEAAVEPPSPDDAERQDPMETLFVRINSSGTPLIGEELVYSILKSIWPEAEGYVERIHTRLALPSRIVVLASRLVLATENAYQETAPAAPDVARFRRLVNGVDRQSRNFRTRLRAFFERGEAARVFGAARDLLISNSWVPLPGTLAADMARHSQDVMFLLLRWVQRLFEAGVDPANLGKTAVLRALGAVTALSWFSENQGQCLQALWPKLQKASERDLPHVLCKGFSPCFALKNGKLMMVPPVPPPTLWSVFEHNMLNRHGVGTPNSHFWRTWTLEDLTTAWIHDEKRLGKKLGSWYRSNFKNLWTLEEAEVPEDGGTGLDGMYQQAWGAFINKLRGDRRLLLFAQREWLRTWFPKYDPTAPDQLDEHDRPWDWDHIHPQAFLKHKKGVPQLIRTWHGSIGNLRAWPFQANRGDGDNPPRQKLVPHPEHAVFQLSREQEVFDASFLEEGEELDSWRGSTPDEQRFPAGYLGDGNGYGWHRRSLLRAILGRLHRIYSTWYDSLLIGDLYG